MLGTVAFNIKDEATVERARRIAARTGETIGEAIATAVAERELRLAATDDERYERVRRLMRRCGERMSAKSVPDIDELLYDPITGLPRDDR